MTMRSTKKPRLADADEKEKDSRGDAFDSTADLLRQTTALSLRLLSMLQEYSDVNPLALFRDSNFALFHLRDELTRNRKNVLKLHMLPGDCSNIVVEFLHVPEACAVQRTCRGFVAMVERSLRCPRARAVSYRGYDVDGFVLDWLVDVYSVCPKFKLAESCRYWASLSDLWRQAVENDQHFGRRGVSDNHPRNFSKALHALLDNTDVDPNCLADSNDTALWSASFYDDVNLVRRLLTYPNIDVNPRFHGALYTRGWGLRYATPLITAAVRGHKRVMSLLLADPRCDVNLRAMRIGRRSAEETVVHAADSGVLEQLLASPRIDPNKRSSDGSTALCQAVDFHKVAFNMYKDEAVMDIVAVRALVACDRVDVNARDSETGNTPLHLLCGFSSDDGDREFYDLLLRHKDIDKNATNDDGESILMAAACHGDVYMIRSLLADEEVVVDCVDDDGNTALHHAVKKAANFEKMAICIDLLRDSGRFDNKVNLRNNDSETALHVLLLHVGKHRPRDALEALLKFPDIDVNAHIDIEEYADYLDTPLHTAVRRGYPDYVELLLGAPGIDLSVQDAEKYTPVALACRLARSIDDPDELCSRTRVFELLLNAPAPDCDLHTRNAGMLRYVASNALHFGYTSVLEIMLATPRPGIDTRAKSSRGRGSISKRETALQYALRKNPSCPRKTRKKVVSIFREARRKGI